jgi:thioredoxin reductase
VGILGESAVTGVKVRRSDGVEEDIAVAGVFIEIGAEPVSEVVDGLAEVDSSGGILVDSNLMTATPGIFAAGAVRSGHRGQIASAIGEGVDAALAAGAWLGSR